MTNHLKFPTWADSSHVHAVVETPRGSRAKLKFDPKLGAFTLANPLPIHDAATYPGLVLTCKPIGVLEVLQSSKGKKETNDRVFVVPDRSPFERDLQDIRRLPSRAIQKSEKFFEATNALEAKTLKFLGWHGPAKAIKTIKKSSLCEEVDDARNGVLGTGTG